MAEIDGLLEMMSSSKVDPNALGAHPRFSQYKNVNRAEQEQRRRREEALARQQQRRFDFQKHARKLAENYSDSEEEMEAENLSPKKTEEQQQAEQAHSPSTRKNGKGRRRRYGGKNRYADELMLSEWLVDIPEQLSDEWIMIPAPIGKRVLVVASKGVTTVYNKAGKIAHQFRSDLPAKGNFTILDCILSDAGIKKIYVLDGIAWNGMILSEMSFVCRRFYLQSRISEEPKLTQPNARHGFVFEVLPQCPCEKGAMERLISDQINFDIDGLLFYYSEVLYYPGQSPLVGWLKPFMMPSLLGVNVPPKYISTDDPQQFIEKFNKEHGHESKVGKETNETSNLVQNLMA